MVAHARIMVLYEGRQEFMQKIADLAISRAYNPPELHLIKVIVCP